jgi:hypothetical protein
MNVGAVQRLVSVGCIMLLGGCWRSHTLHQPDGGVSNMSDAGVPDFGTDLPARGDTDCGVVGSIPACSSTCECPPLSGCAEAGFCHSRHASGIPDSCNFQSTSVRGLFTHSGDPCAIAPTSGEPQEYVGVGVDVEFCLDAASVAAGVRCVWSDATSVDALPPDDACPMAIPFCGGTCGDVMCPDAPNAIVQSTYSCVGVSSSRAFGVCATLPYRCQRDDVPGTLDICARSYGEACSCLVFEDGMVSDGIPIPSTLCDAYADHHSSVRCEDANW